MHDLVRAGVGPRQQRVLDRPVPGLDRVVAQLVPVIAVADLRDRLAAEQVRGPELLDGDVVDEVATVHSSSGVSSSHLAPIWWTRSVNSWAAVTINESASMPEFWRVDALRDRSATESMTG